MHMTALAGNATCEESRSKHWLNECLGEYDPAEGFLKLQSTVTWAAALRFEIERKHGTTPDDQLDSCRRHFRSQQVDKGPRARLGQTYCGLFHSLSSASTLVSLDCNGSGRPWMYPTAVVTWYYAHYHALRSLLLARNQNVGDSHAAVQKASNGIVCRLLPHPYNMCARFDVHGNTIRTLPDAPGAVKAKLVTSFDETSQMAQGMLLNYLRSTANQKKAQIEKTILKENPQYTDFKRKAAQDLRNAKLEGLEFNFMHCAFRYRGKANYRDPLYLTYGTRARDEYDRFLHNLTVSARFAFILGVAFAERAYGACATRTFIADMERNFRGLKDGCDDERFWRSFAEDVQHAQ
jgi:hypothetical protein